MGTLIFPVDDTLRSIVAHTQAHPEMTSYYGEEITAPSLFFVKDHGAYIMSASKEPQLIEEGKSNRVVAYALGHDPGKDTYDWDFTRAVCGGDDFAECMPLDWFVSKLNAGADELRIVLSGDTLELKGFIKATVG